MSQDLTKGCPRCAGPLAVKRPALNALSRKDNDTYICSGCGTLEAFYNLAHPGRELPDVNICIG